MTYITPINAANLAGEVYAVNERNPASLKIFLSNSLFSSGSTKVLSAEVGFRAMSAPDGFGVCALGSGVYANHVIIVFRGTTEVNKKGDWASNARIGVETSFSSNEKSIPNKLIDPYGLHIEANMDYALIVDKGQRALMALDLESGERVVVSKSKN